MHEVIYRVLHNAVLRARKPAVKVGVLLAAGFFVGQQVSLRGQQPANSTSVTPAPAAVGPQMAPPGEYSINVGDTLDVYVYDVPELSHTYPVGPAGTITVPLLAKPVQAVGLTPDQLAHSLEEAFRQSGRLQRPEISVSVKQSLGNSVAVEGGVKAPQMVSAMGRVRLGDVITQCGGLPDETVRATATITRGALAMQALGAAATPTVTVDAMKAMNPSDPASEIGLWPGDRVVVESQPPVYYVLGEVRSPGGYTIKNGQEELTLLRALAMAGDVTSFAKTKKIFIIRKDAKAPNGRAEIQISMASVLKGTVPDPRVLPEDILFIPGSNAKKALHLIEAAPEGLLVGGTAAAIYH